MAFFNVDVTDVELTSTSFKCKVEVYLDYQGGHITLDSRTVSGSFEPGAESYCETYDDFDTPVFRFTQRRCCFYPRERSFAYGTTVKFRQTGDAEDFIVRIQV